MNGIEELICRALHDRASDHEEAQLRAWRRASLRNERYHHDFVRLLMKTNSAAWEEVASRPPPVEKLIRSGGSRMPSGAVPLRQRCRAWIDERFPRILPVAVVAGFVLVAAFGLLKNTESTDGHHLGTGEISTSALETTSVRLGDGTVVRLAPDSRMQILDTPGMRDVWIEGRAYFAVMHMADVPFRVRSLGGEVIVRGTRFDVEAQEESLRLLVVDGAVTLASRGATVELGASQMGRVVDALPPTREEVDAAYVADELEWLGNVLFFDATPLHEAALELSQHYGVPVRIVDEALGLETVRGLFIDQSLDEVVGLICEALSATCEILDAGVTIGR